MNKKTYLVPRSTQFVIELENMIACSKDDDYDGTVEIPPFGEWESNHRGGWSSDNWSNSEEE